jgi:hypothetical protein
MNALAMSVRHVCVLVFGVAVVVTGAHAASDYRNVTTGAALRPGVYGRIEVRSNAVPPPLIYPQPVVANGSIERIQREPVYLYVPPGQVRKWKQNCAKWSACDDPVLFVRVDQSPSRWGQWRQLRDQVAWDARNPAH